MRNPHHTRNARKKSANTKRWSPIGQGFDPLQEWEGCVLTADATSITARLRDLTAGSSCEEEEAEIPIEGVPQEDRPRVQPGAFFRWSIGHEHTESGMRRRVSVIVFREPSIVTEKDLSDGQAWATETRRMLGL